MQASAAARGSFSGQSYLLQVAQGTGGTAYYQGTGNPVSLAPFLKKFQSAIAETYVATFPVDANKKMVSLKLSTTLPKTKLNAPSRSAPEPSSCPITTHQISASQRACCGGITPHAVQRRLTPKPSRGAHLRHSKKSSS